MIGFFPLKYYTPLYHYFILMVVLVVFFQLQTEGYRRTVFGVFWLGFIIIYMGLRPISYYFGDMGTYARVFSRYQQGENIDIGKDILFNLFMKYSSFFMSSHMFFLLCAFLYVYPLYLVCKKWFSNYWFYAFLLLAASFSFWTYGTNGIRSGIASSLFLLGVSRTSRFNQITWIVASLGVHLSMLLPTLAFVLAQFYNQPKKIILLWVMCIPLSLLAGGFWENFFASLGFGDERIAYLTQENIYQDDFKSTGFRWDFLLYSATAVYAGWYYITKKGFHDKVYFWLFNTYVVTNAFWILVIRANFSNRFAYLSWFMMALVIVYPLLKKRLFRRQYALLANIIMAYFAFTFLMNVIL
ncbi:MAG: EpsG family protein [Cryomorphaceae bacterium]|nr:EpsG family protein [Cryomorphaceae bacterium]